MYDFGEILSLLNKERDTSKEKFIGQYSHTPNINFMIVVFLTNGLRREVYRSTTEGVSELG
jgi:hypothetical protein